MAKHTRTGPWIELKDRIQLWGYRATAWLVQHLPHSLTRRLGGAVGKLVYRFDSAHPRWARENIAIAYPELSTRAVAKMARDSYEHFGWNAIDFMRAEKWSDEEVSRRVTIVNQHYFDDALAQGRGMFVATAHLGNFELAARIFGLLGPRPLLVGRPMRNRHLYDHLIRSRTRTGSVEIIDRKRAAIGMYRAIKDNRPIAILNDQYSRRTRGVFVPFFGVRCSTTAGIATIALRMNSPVISGTIVRVAPDHHQITFGPPIEIESTGDRKKDVELATAAYNEAIEAHIRGAPEQWMWAQRRFRHSPDLDAPPYQVG